MRADIEASVGTPKARPIEAALDPTSLSLKASGQPTLSVSPFEVELPTVQVTLPRLSLTLPSPTVTVKLPKPEITATAEFDAGPPPKFSVSVELDPGNLEITLNIGQLAVDLGTTSIDFGKFRFHGVPVQGDDARFDVGLDLDSLVSAEFGGLTTRLQGCLVLNGGDCLPPRPCHEPCHPAAEKPPDQFPPSPQAQITAVKSEKAEQGALDVAILGVNFGDVEGSVRIRQNSVQVSAVVLEWQATQVLARFTDAPSTGTYSLELLNPAGVVIASTGVSL